MADFAQMGVPDWIFLGEKARLELLRWLLPEAVAPDWGESLVWVEYGSSSAIRRGLDDFWQVQSSCLLPGMTALVAATAEQVAAVGKKRETRVGVLEEFPFGRQSTYETLRTIHQEDPVREVLVVLLDLPLLGGSTDLDAPEDQLEEQYQAYRKEEEAVILYGAGDLPGLLAWRQDTLLGQRRMALQELTDMQELIRVIRYDYEYMVLDDLQETLLAPAQLERICSFHTAKRGLAYCVWVAYQRKAEAVFFPPSDAGGFTEPVAKLYRSTLRVLPPAFWDIDKDCDLLAKKLRQAWRAWMRQPKWEHLQLSPDTEADYEKLVAESGINAAFLKRLMEFVNEEALRVLEEYLQCRYNGIKEVLK